MLILPPGHAQQVRAPRRAGAREKWMVRIGGVLAVALAVFAVVAIATKGHHSGNGCVDVTISYSLGGAEIYECGAKAKRFCISSGQPGGYTGAAGRTVSTQCRKAGLAFG